MSNGASNLPKLSEEIIVDLMKKFMEKYNGDFPHVKEKRIIEEFEIYKITNWNSVDYSLYVGQRGLPGKNSLAKLSKEYLGKKKYILSSETIVEWIKLFHDKYGEYPKFNDSRRIPEMDLSWCAIDASLKRGQNGLPGGDSVANMIYRYFGKKNIKNLHNLYIDEIVDWMILFEKEYGKYPTQQDNRVIKEMGEETWKSINSSLLAGRRGLEKSSLGKIKEKYFDVKNQKNLPKLSISQIIEWTTLFIKEFQCYPTRKDKRIIPEMKNETWSIIDTALEEGLRGLPKSSLADFLYKYFDKRNQSNLPNLNINEILNWMKLFYDEYHILPGRRDKRKILEMGKETWNMINFSLRKGLRGLPPNTSLVKLKQKYFKNISKTSYYYESLCINIMENIFNKEFESSWPKTLRNRNNRWLQLDCYNEELKINIEYDGEQHFIFPNRYQKTKEQFKRGQENDYDKNQWCANNSILQIRVSYKYDTKRKIENYIKEQLILNNRYPKDNTNIIASELEYIGAYI